MLSAEVLLPNLVAVITEDMLSLPQSKRPSSSSNPNQQSYEITLRVTALNTLRGLIEGSSNLTEDHHFDSLT